MDKHITDEGKNQILKLAFLSGERHPFKYCALGKNDSALAASTKDSGDFSEFIIGENQYARAELNLDEKDIQNGQLIASCIFNENNYDTETGQEIGEIALCDAADGNDTIYFAFSEVPKIKKTGTVSLKYTWIINIE